MNRIGRPCFIGGKELNLLRLILSRVECSQLLLHSDFLRRLRRCVVRLEVVLLADRRWPVADLETRALDH